MEGRGREDVFPKAVSITSSPLVSPAAAALPAPPPPPPCAALVEAVTAELFRVL